MFNNMIFKNLFWGARTFGKSMLNGFFDINIENFTFMDSLSVMVQGMVSIFLVTCALIICVHVLNKMSKKDK